MNREELIALADRFESDGQLGVYTLVKYHHAEIATALRSQASSASTTEAKPMTESEGKLLPCPFCGSASVKLYNNKPARMSWVSCIECGLEAPTETGTSDSDALKYWNVRTPAQPASGGVDPHDDPALTFYPPSPASEAGREADIQRCLNTIENVYAFECEAGPLKNCGEWRYLKRLLTSPPHPANQVVQGTTAEPDQWCGQESAEDAVSEIIRNTCWGDHYHDVTNEMEAAKKIVAYFKSSEVIDDRSQANASSEGSVK